jgi:hypothetical protein
VNEIFGEKDGYIQEYKNATLETGGKIEIKGDLKVKLVAK